MRTIGSMSATSRRIVGRATGSSVAVLSALLTGLLGCEPIQDDEPDQVAHSCVKSVLLLTLDTTRFDALSCLGGPPGLTPNLDQLASEGILYEQARTVAPTTLPSHASMLTGLYPLRHGLHVNGIDALGETATTVAEQLSAAGVDSAAFVASVVLDESYGLDQGFGQYDQVERPEVKLSAHYERRDAEQMVDAALPWLLERGARPYFAWIHFFDPHAPYTNRPRFLASGNGSPYLGEVAFMDHHIGRLLESLETQGLLRSTLVIVVGDHGESLGDHGEETHGMFCYEPVMRVPFIVRYPRGHRAGERSSEIVSVVDVGPTICAALGVALPAADGQALYKQRVEPERGVYVESLYGYSNYGWSQIVGWVDARRKFLHSSLPELYDLSSDPGELHNLLGSAASSDEVAEYMSAIEAIAARPRLAVSAGADEQLADDVASLGYVIGPNTGIEELFDTQGRTAPSQSLLELARIQQAFSIAAQRPPLEAAEAWAQVLAINPRNVTAIAERGYQLLRAERWAAAAELYEQALSLGQTRSMNLMNYGVCLEQQGRREAAIEQYRLASQRDPRNLLALDNLARALSLEGRLNKAEGVRAQRAAVQ